MQQFVAAILMGFSAGALLMHVYYNYFIGKVGRLDVDLSDREPKFVINLYKDIRAMNSGTMLFDINMNADLRKTFEDNRE